MKKETFQYCDPTRWLLKKLTRDYNLIAVCTNINPGPTCPDEGRDKSSGRRTIEKCDYFSDARTPWLAVLTRRPKIPTTALGDLVKPNPMILRELHETVLLSGFYNFSSRHGSLTLICFPITTGRKERCMPRGSNWEHVQHISQP